MELRFVTVLSLIGAVGLAAATPAEAFDYEIYGNLRIQGQDFDPIYDYVDPAMTTSLSLEGSRVGSLAGNEAGARWTADLALGSISGYAHGSNAFVDVLGWRWANGDLQAFMKDTLTLDLPAGDYPQGAQVGLSGFVNGSLESSGIDLYADATVYWKIELQRLDDYGYDSVEDSRTASNGKVVGVAEPFAPSLQVLSPGSSLATPKSVTFRFLAQLQVIADTYDSIANQHLEETADFGDTLQFVSVDAPPGTTWASASGVFLPEPAVAVQAAMAVLALAALAVWRGVRRGLEDRSSRPRSPSASKRLNHLWAVRALTPAAAAARLTVQPKPRTRCTSSRSGGRPADAIRSRRLLAVGSSWQYGQTLPSWDLASAGRSRRTTKRRTSLRPRCSLQLLPNARREQRWGPRGHSAHPRCVPCSASRSVWSRSFRMALPRCFPSRIFAEKKSAN